MKFKTNIIGIGLHILFWIVILYFFVNYSYLRPSSQELVYKEYLCVGLIIVMVYLNYLFLIPKFLQKGRLVIYWGLAILSIFAVTVGEYFLFKSVVTKCYSGNLSGEQFNRFMGVQFFLYLTRITGFFLFFFVVKLYQDLSSKYIAESQAIANTTQTMAVMESDKEIKIINISDIVYLSHHKNYTYFHMITGKKYFQYISLKRVEELFPQKTCLRINKSNIIMFSQVIDYNSTLVTLNLIENEKQVSLQISTKYKEDVLSKLKKHKNSHNTSGGSKRKNGGKKIRNGEGKMAYSVDLAEEKEEKKRKSEPTLLENEILAYISEHPNCKFSEIFMAINKPKRTIERSIKNMKEIGLIEYRGANKNGGYHATEKI
ncbi:MAG: LytTR family transcriptional regulator DNA-binding domain-containing protein [Bacteroidales bacterium]|jgi:predicted transcriptional regulator|nr:LytTR family transcriptional regulator DNA-binding domain-containing protein [Bacteroidales bacterium]